MTEQMIVEAVRAAGSSPAIQGAQAVQPSMDPAAVSRFEAAMRPEAVASVPLASQIAETWRVAQDNHQGLLHRIRALTEMRGVRGPSAAELSELQYNVANLSFQQEVVTSVAKKASDAVSTLVKNG